MGVEFLGRAPGPQPGGTAESQRSVLVRVCFQRVDRQAAGVGVDRLGGFIDAAQLEALGEQVLKSGYGRYLIDTARD